MFLRGCSRINHAVTVRFISYKVTAEVEPGFTVKDSQWRDGREEMRWKTDCLLRTHTYSHLVTTALPIIISHCASVLPKQMRGVIITVIAAICHLDQITTLDFKNMSPTCCRKLKLYSRVRKMVIGCFTGMTADRKHSAFNDI